MKIASTDVCYLGHSDWETFSCMAPGSKRCRPCQRRLASEYYQRTRKYQQSRRLDRTFGLGAAATFLKLIHLQGRKCAICGVKLTTNRRGKSRSTAHLDHCHKSGKIRAVLCTLCNVGLGSFRDNTVFLRAAAKYLTKHR
jgi:hypothetical protein